MATAKAAELHKLHEDLETVLELLRIINPEDVDPYEIDVYLRMLDAMEMEIVRIERDLQIILN